MCAAPSNEKPGSAEFGLYELCGSNSNHPQPLLNQEVSQSRRVSGERDSPLHTLRRWAGRIQGAVPALAFDEFPELATAALEIEAGRLRTGGIPQLFASDLIRIPPTLNDDLLDLYGRSEQVLANRFGFFGVTREFRARIDWEPDCGAAWRAELHSFDYALDLALTFRISGDERYARHLRYLIAEWIASSPVGRTSGSFPLALARRLRNWILAASLASEAFERDAAFLEIFTASLARQVTFLSWQACNSDDPRTGLAASRALLLASRYFPCARGNELRDSAQALMLRASDGTAASNAEHSQPLRQFDLAAAWCDHALFGGRVGADGPARARAHLYSALETLEGMLHPDGTLPLFGCQPLPSAGEVSELFALGAALLEVPRWKSLSGGLGIFPYMLLGEAGKHRFELLPAKTWHAHTRLDSDLGIVCVSDGGSSALLAAALPRASGEDHQDIFSYELTVGGQRTVVDSGIFAPPGDIASDGFAAARAHNVLLVDGVLPCPRITRVESIAIAPTVDVQGLWLRAIEETPPRESPLRRWLGARRAAQGCFNHHRGFFLIEGRYWVVLDCLAGSGTRRIESLVHFYPAFAVELLTGSVAARSGAVSVRISPLSRGGAAVKSVSQRNADSCAWYAPAPGVRYPGEVVAVEWKAVGLPWVGGYLIQSEGDDKTHAYVASASTNEVTVGIGDRVHSIPMPGDSPE